MSEVSCVEGPHEENVEGEESEQRPSRPEHQVTDDLVAHVIQHGRHLDHCHLDDRTNPCTLFFIQSQEPQQTLGRQRFTSIKTFLKRSLYLSEGGKDTSTRRGRKIETNNDHRNEEVKPECDKKGNLEEFIKSRLLHHKFVP